MLIIYIIIGLFIFIAIFVLIQYKRKSIYSGNVYREFEQTPDSQQLQYVLQNHPNQELRENLAVMQIEILKRCYSNNIAPPLAAEAMIGALKEMLNDHEYNS